MMIEVLDVQGHGPEHMLLALQVTDDEGNTARMAHYMPRDAAEWRVAEYGLDPDDHDTLIDVLLFEQHAHANGDIAEEDQLHLAPTVEHAREALLGAVRARKATSEAKRTAARGRKADPEPAVRLRVKDMFDIHPEAVEAKREYVGMARERMQAERAARPSLAGAERAANIRNLMATPPPPRSESVDIDDQAGPHQA
jgi:hypothetical protein